MITHRVQRIALIILDAFLAATTVAGGLGLLFGWITLPLAWLNGSPFSSYTIPGLMRSLQAFYFTCGLLTGVVAMWPWTPQHVARLRHARHRP